MKRALRKSLALVMAAVLLAALMPIHAMAAEETGSWGDNIRWQVSGTTLTITGQGAMKESEVYSYPSWQFPWTPYAGEITHVVIGSGVTGIAGYAFRGFRKLEHVSFGSDLTFIGGFAFELSSLPAVTVPSTVTGMGEGVFMDCAQLKSVEFYASCEIPRLCFDGCEALTSVTIGSGIPAIMPYAFFECTSLQEITVPAGVERILMCAFAECEGLERVTLPEGLKEIGSEAFRETAVQEIVIPDSVTSMGYASFRDCPELTKATFGTGLATVPRACFYGSSKLAEVNMGSVRTIDTQAFLGCKALNGITLPKTLEIIGDGAFSYCLGLTSLEIPGSVTRINDSAFSYCSGLSEIIFRGSAPTFGTYVNQVGEFIFGEVTATAYYPEKDPSWTKEVMLPYDGTITWVPYDAPEPEEIPATPMYRLYNPNSGEHFYTGSAEERDMLTAAGWNYEGVAWNAPTQSGDPVYRLYNPNSGDHHYTMSAQERDMLVGFGWRYEGVCWNSAPSDQLPLYRLYNPNADCGSHHYTGSTQERDNLVNVGWIFEGIGWFGLP